MLLSNKQRKTAVYYILSCDCVTTMLLIPRGCTTTCPRHLERVFILETVYERPVEAE
jgi:hypothetical protein